MANDAVWNRFISELLDKNDIVDVISSYIDVKPKGRGYWALCPFHNDRNPSLSINREGQYFHCFVCGVGGNAIRFIMKYESCSFMEAVETLAKRAGLEVRQKRRNDAAYERKKGKTDSLRRLPRSRAFYHASLMSEKGLAQKISRKQGIGLSAVRRFSMGYSPDGIRLIFI
ncbi:MAG: CHC2 zinc finger domain-containing protein [Lachnospiraceae bacterium]